MKYKTYESKGIILFIILIFIFIEILFIVYLASSKMYKYKSMTAIAIKKDLVELIVNKDNRKIIYKNSVVYINHHKRHYEIVEDRGIITEQDGIKYYDILLKIDNDLKLKSHDTLELVWQDKKVRLIKVLIKIWEGD